MFFSWKCAVSNESIACTYAKQPIEQSECYLVTPDKVYYEPNYRGQGDFGGVDVYALLGNGDREIGIIRSMLYPDQVPFDIKVVLAKYYKNQSYDELPPSEICERKGMFYNDLSTSENNELRGLFY